ncbi:hypothetical protein Thermus77420_16710 [Thermus thalpophilus]
MRKLLLLLLLIGLENPVFAQKGEALRDALHGFALFLPTGYQVRVEEYGLLATDLEAFLLVRGMPLRTPREAVAPLVAEAQRMAKGQVGYHFKATGGGLLLLARGMGYPFPLSGALSLSALQDPFLAGLTYEAAHLLLPGRKHVLAVSVYLPTDASPALRDQALQALRSLEFLPESARVHYEVQRVRDPVLGMDAFTVEVPRGYAFQGALAYTGDGDTSVRTLVFALQGNGVLYRKDALFLGAGTVAGGPYGASSGSTVFGWNGQRTILQGFLCPTTPEEVARLLAELWGQERGQAWQVAKLEPTPAPRSRVAQRLAQEEASLEGYLSPMVARGAQPFRGRWDHTLEARAGHLVREGYFGGTLFGYQQQDWVATSAMCQTQLNVLFREGTAAALAKAKPILDGFTLGLRPNPEWPWREALRARRASEEETRRVLAMVRQGEEFNTWMRRSWANLLSDQTYVRDPATGEVFKAYKESFNTGTFWRDPVFGGVLGAVERDGRLEDLLRQGGWRRLEESLSGLPGTWRR